MLLASLAYAVIQSQYLHSIRERLVEDNNPVVSYIKDERLLSDGLNFCNDIDVSGVGGALYHQGQVLSVEGSQHMHTNYLAEVDVNATEYLCPNHREDMRIYIRTGRDIPESRE